MRKYLLLACCLTFCWSVSYGALDVKQYLSGIKWAEPRIVEPGYGTLPPSDATVLFGGTDLEQWGKNDTWKIKTGYFQSGKGSLRTKESFGDCQLHLEFATPSVVKGNSQGRGNSGVYIMGKYEVQILDSYENKTYFDGQCAALYKQSPPLVNASRMPGEWQTYDIIFLAPKFNEKKELVSPAYVTVIHNGVLVHHHLELAGQTGFKDAPKYKHHPAKQPLTLQDHGNPIRFRNIWIRPIERSASILSEEEQKKIKMQEEAKKKKEEEEKKKKAAEAKAKAKKAAEEKKMKAEEAKKKAEEKAKKDNKNKDKKPNKEVPPKPTNKQKPEEAKPVEPKVNGKK